MIQPTVLETPHCTFVLNQERLLIQRFKPSMRFEPRLIEHASAVRDRLIGDAPCALLVTIPAAVPVNPDASNTDHFQGERSRRRIIALTVVAEGQLLRSAAKLYFAWFQQAFPVLVTDSEAHAMDWLREWLRDAA
ncbi:MAG: hypothetical protein ACK4L7_03640 [Flavobacteriales bacterium]